MIVGLHAGFLKDVNEYVSFLTVEGLFRIAVPLFFIINGYFYHLYYERKYIDFFKKLFTRGQMLEKMARIEGVIFTILMLYVLLRNFQVLK